MRAKKMVRNEAYREAEKKIEEARRTGATELDLSNPQWKDPKPPQLTELPDTIGQLSQLRSLSLNDNKLMTVPDTIGQLAQLQILNLRNNKLMAVPDAISQLTQLWTLYLNSNQLTVVPETIGQLTWLQWLYLFDNQLTAIPDTIGELTWLQELDLANNQLTAIPDTIGQLIMLQSLNLSYNRLTVVPDTIGQLTRLHSLDLEGNELTVVPNTIGQFIQLQSLNLSYNQLTTIPDIIGQLLWLRELNLASNQLTAVLETIGQLTKLQSLDFSSNQLADIPGSLAQLEHLEKLELDGNPLNPELAAAYKEGLDAVKTYLRAKARAQIRLNEAKLILVGEGEVGKTCLMDALAGQAWQEHPTTHGIEIRTISAVDPAGGTELTLNGWDFGGQRVYRPTHQLFFSSPAVYLVVWKPREGPQAGFVKEWIKLIKHREPEAKILVVATHGGPQQRQPDIDRQELWDLFGKDTVLDFFHVDSKPDANGQRRGIADLKTAIASAAAHLPEMGREVPKSFEEARQTLTASNAAYLPLEEVYAICAQHSMDDELARLFVAISHRLGHLIHYAHDPALRDIVVLKPSWLATAISFVLDDAATRDAQGLVPFSRLRQIWDDPTRAAADRYAADLHPIFLRLMERFDLSYRVAGLSNHDDDHSTSLIAQLVPDTRPEKRLAKAWPSAPSGGDSQQTQICRIVDEKGQSAPAEGLFYQL
ncbi:MAG: leucine-rich repeat domain-containing protein, partial [Anaerolineales bacterium]|nr:leucine-rich repeat domain-containing protein [Anaerolineales bacterium]